jgi:hypothetical protein
MNDPVGTAWQIFVSHDRQLQAPPHLESRIMAATAHQPGPAASTGAVGFAFALAAAIALAVAAWPVRHAALPAPLAVQPLLIAAFPAPIAPDRPGPPAPIARSAEITAHWSAMYQDLPVMLMVLDAMNTPQREPLQLVRLRIPREALQALGVPLFEPEARGLVDVDVLIGEDGLPRDVRRVRADVLKARNP